MQPLLSIRENMNTNLRLSVSLSRALSLSLSLSSLLPTHTLSAWGRPYGAAPVSLSRSLSRSLVFPLIYTHILGSRGRSCGAAAVWGRQGGGSGMCLYVFVYGCMCTSYSYLCIAMFCNVLQCVAVCCSVCAGVGAHRLDICNVTCSCVAWHIRMKVSCHMWMSYTTYKSVTPKIECVGTGWRRLIGCLKLQVIFRKRVINYRALLRKMTYKDKAFYGSSPPWEAVHACIVCEWVIRMYECVGGGSARMYCMWISYTHAWMCHAKDRMRRVLCLTCKRDATHGGDQTSNIWISRSNDFLVTFLEWQGLRLHTWKPVQIWGLPWNCVWYVRGLRWKLVGNFGSRNCVKSDLLRLWPCTYEHVRSYVHEWTCHVTCVSMSCVSVSCVSMWCVSMWRAPCLSDKAY